MSHDQRHMTFKRLDLDVNKQKELDSQAYTANFLINTFPVPSYLCQHQHGALRRPISRSDPPMASFISTFTVLWKPAWKMLSERTPQQVTQAKDRSSQTMRPLKGSCFLRAIGLISGSESSQPNSHFKTPRPLSPPPGEKP